MREWKTNDGEEEKGITVAEIMSKIICFATTLFHELIFCDNPHSFE